MQAIDRHKATLATDASRASNRVLLTGVEAFIFPWRFRRAVHDFEKIIVRKYRMLKPYVEPGVINTGQ